MEKEKGISAIKGRIYYYNKGVCRVCNRDTEPIIEFQSEYGRGDFAICSDCTQLILAEFEKQDL